MPTVVNFTPDLQIQSRGIYSLVLVTNKAGWTRLALRYSMNKYSLPPLPPRLYSLRQPYRPVLLSAEPALFMRNGDKETSISVKNPDQSFLFHSVME